MNKQRKPSRPPDKPFTASESLKYDWFIDWAQECGHYQVTRMAANFERYLKGEEGNVNGSA